MCNYVNRWYTGIQCEWGTFDQQQNWGTPLIQSLQGNSLWNGFFETLTNLLQLSIFKCFNDLYNITKECHEHSVSCLLFSMNFDFWLGLVLRSFQNPQISQIEGFSPPFYLNRTDGLRWWCVLYTFQAYKQDIPVRVFTTSQRHSIFSDNWSFIVPDMYIPETHIKLDAVSLFFDNHQSELLICCDFNFIWSSSNTDTKRKKSSHNLVLLNDNSGNRFGSNGQLLPLDLTSTPLYSALSIQRLQSPATLVKWRLH